MLIDINQKLFTLSALLWQEKFEKKFECFSPQKDKAATQSNANKKVVICHKILCPEMRDMRAVASHADGEVGSLQPLWTFPSFHLINPYLLHSHQWKVNPNKSWYKNVVCYSSIAMGEILLLGKAQSVTHLSLCVTYSPQTHINEVSIYLSQLPKCPTVALHYLTLQCMRWL